MKGSTYESPIVTRPTPLILLAKVIALALFFNILFILTSVAYTYLRQYFESPYVAEPTVFLVLFIIEATFFFFMIVAWLSEYIVVDDHFIFHKKGILFTKENHYKLDTIHNMTTEQNPLGKMLRFASIRIAYSNSEIAILHSVPYPNQFIYLIEQKINQFQGSKDNKEDEHARE